jgi:hypothetical protein
MLKLHQSFVALLKVRLGNMKNNLVKPSKGLVSFSATVSNNKGYRSSVVKSIKIVQIYTISLRPWATQIGSKTLTPDKADVSTRGIILIQFSRFLNRIQKSFMFLLVLGKWTV